MNGKRVYSVFWEQINLFGTSLMTSNIRGDRDTLPQFFAYGFLEDAKKSNF